ncbi:MAG: flagellar protein FlaG [Spirochaetaceae bacterium]|nr:flagellar protein FlaG [Spirochaetaceae bacterium]
MNLKVIGSSGSAGNMEVTDTKKIVLQTQVPPTDTMPKDAPKDAPPPEVNLENLKRALQVAVKNTRYNYSFHEAMNTVVVKIIDGNTDKVIKEIPAKEIQRLHENIHQAIGLLFDQEI